MKRINAKIYQIIILCVIILFEYLPSIAQNKSIQLKVKQVSFTNWNAEDGVLYKQVPGANLGTTSFEIMDSNRTAYLCNSSNEIIIINNKSGRIEKKFNVSFAPRDFTYCNKCFYVLFEYQVIQYDEMGKEIDKFSIPASSIGVERLANFDSSTYLLLPSGNSLMIESNGHLIVPQEKEGWITGSGLFVKTNIIGGKQYAIRILKNNYKIFEKTYITDKKVAGVYVVGATNNRLVLDVQTFILENPISVERNIIVINLDSIEFGTVVTRIKVPDCYYVLSNRDFAFVSDGYIYNMLSAPQGVFVFKLIETKSDVTQNYPSFLIQMKYHFNDHLIQVDEK